MLPSALVSTSVILAAGTIGWAISSTRQRDQGAEKPGSIILLKLDDIAQHPDAAIHPNWQRVTDYLEKHGIKAGMGIVGDSLETDNPAYIQWIKEHHQRGIIEFWCHGYRSRTMEDKHGEFEVGSAAEQGAILERCQRLAREKLGFIMAAFGPHWSGTTDATDEALQGVPEIKIWLWGPAEPKFFKGLCLPRIIRLEDPIFVPDFAKFQEAYDLIGAREKVLVLQGHSAAWDGGRWEDFVRIIEFLQSKNCIFMTPSEYLQSIKDR